MAVNNTYSQTSSVINTPGGGNTTVQYNKNGSFAGDNGLKYNHSTKELSVQGNINIGGWVKGKIYTNTYNFFLNGGNSGQVLSTDGTGNLSWVDNSGGGSSNYGNSNVSSYLATFTGNVAAGNVKTNNLLYANGVAWNFGSTYANSNVASYLPTFTGNVAAGNIKTDNLLYANGVAWNFGSTYANSNVANYLPTYSGSFSPSNIHVTTNSLLGDNSTPGQYYVYRDTNQVSLGQTAAQSIDINSSGISIVGTGGVNIQGAVSANISIGGGTTGNVILPKGITFADGSYQNTAATSGASTGNLELTGAGIFIADGADETLITISPNIEGQSYLKIPNDATANVANVRLHNDSGNIEFGTGSGSHLWYFNNNGEMVFPDGTLMGSVEGANTFGFYNNNANTEFLIEAADNAWSFDGSTGTLTYPDGTRTTGAGLTIPTNSSYEINTGRYPSISAACYIGNGDEFVADTEFNDDIIGVEVGWTVVVGGTTYTVTSIDPSPPAHQYRITAAGATFVTSTTYTFTSNVANESTWVFDELGQLVTPGAGIISHQTNDLKIEATGETDVIVLRTTGGDVVVNADSSLSLGDLTVTANSVHVPSTGSFEFNNADFSSAEWVTSEGGGQINISSVSTNFSDFLYTLTEYASVSLLVNGTANIPYTGVSIGGGSAVLYTSAPLTDPTTVTTIVFNTIFNNGLVLDVIDGPIGLKIADFDLDISSQGDINITAGDDLRLLGNDFVGLTGNGQVSISSNAVGSTNEWIFSSDGGLELPPALQTQKSIKGSVETIIGYPYPASTISGDPITVWTASSSDIIGAKMTLRIQNWNGTNVEMLDVMLAKQLDNTNVSYSISNRLKTNESAPDALVSVELTEGDNLTVLVTTISDAAITYNVTEFENTFD